MGKEWLWWLGEFGLAATVAIVAGFVTRDIPISILYGLFVGTVFFVLRQNSRVASQFHQEVTNLEDKVLDLPVTISKLEDAHPYMKHLALSAKEDTIRFVKGAIEGEILVKLQSMPQIATELAKLPQPGDKVLATNYWAHNYTPQSDTWRQACFEAAAKGVDFTRVFIEGDEFSPEETNVNERRWTGKKSTLM